MCFNQESLKICTTKWKLNCLSWWLLDIFISPFHTFIWFDFFLSFSSCQDFILVSHSLLNFFFHSACAIKIFVFAVYGVSLPKKTELWFICIYYVMLCFILKMGPKFFLRRLFLLLKELHLCFISIHKHTHNREKKDIEIEKEQI